MVTNRTVAIAQRFEDRVDARPVDAEVGLIVHFDEEGWFSRLQIVARSLENKSLGSLDVNLNQIGVWELHFIERLCKDWAIFRFDKPGGPSPSLRLQPGLSVPGRTSEDLDIGLVVEDDVGEESRGEGFDSQDLTRLISQPNAVSTHMSADIKKDASFGQEVEKIIRDPGLVVECYPIVGILMGVPEQTVLVKNPQLLSSSPD
jgi:hypothetical protein